METSPLICGANQWTGFYMIAASVMKGLNIRHLFSALMNLAHLVRACNFKFPFLHSSFICFSIVKLISIVMPRNFSLELRSIKELLILMDFALKGDKNI